MATPLLARQSERRVTFALEPMVLQEFPLFIAFDSNGSQAAWICRHCQRIPFEWTSLHPPPNRIVDMHLISCDGLNTGEEKTFSIPKQNSGDITTHTAASLSPNSMEIRNAARDLLLIRSSKETRLKPLVVSFDDNDEDDDIKVKQVKHVRKKSQDLIHGETWTCKCGNQNAVEKMRCGKCLHWKGGRRNVTWSTTLQKQGKWEIPDDL
jgi:hypothetical protein